MRGLAASIALVLAGHRGVGLWWRRRGRWHRRGGESAARRQALAHHAPPLLSRRVIDGLHFAIVDVEGLSMPRRYELVLPAIGEPGHDVTELIARLREAVADW